MPSVDAPVANNGLVNDNFPEDGILLEVNKRKELLTFCQQAFEQGRSGRLRFERQWYTNLAFYFGKQWVVWTPGVNGNNTRLYNPPAPPWRVRLVSNKIRPIIRKELAKVTKENPTTFIIPASSDDADIAAARAGDRFSEHNWGVLQMKKKMRRSLFWMLITGSSFMKDWYDPRDTDIDKKPGTIKAEPVSPFHIFVPNLETEEIEDQPWVLHVLAKEPSWVSKVYGKEVQPDTSGSAGILEQKFLSAMGANDNTKDKRSVMVKELWVKPNAKFPNGAVITWAGEEILSVKEEWPYEHGEYPFTKFDHVPTGRFYADSVITDLIPLQKEFNRTRSQIIEAKNRMSKPQLLAARGSVDPRKITSEPGLVVLYTPGFPVPAPLPLQNLPGYVLQELDRSQNDMNDIASQHEITKGQTPPGVEAATAISFLQEQDDSSLSHTIASIEEGVEKLGRHFLSHVQQFWEQARTIRYIGENGQLEALEFSKAVLQGNIDLRVQAGSATPRSLAAKQAFIMELGKIGWIPPDKALRYLEMTETSRMYEESQIDSRQVHRENLLISQGVVIPPNTWDKHEIHIQEHNDYRKKQEYLTLDPQIQMIFEAHVQMHQNILAQASMGMMPGAGPLQNLQSMMGAMGGQNSQAPGPGMRPESPNVQNPPNREPSARFQQNVEQQGVQ